MYEVQYPESATYFDPWGGLLTKIMGKLFYCSAVVDVPNSELANQKNKTFYKERYEWWLFPNDSPIEYQILVDKKVSDVAPYVHLVPGYNISGDTSEHSCIRLTEARDYIENKYGEPGIKRYEEVLKSGNGF